MKIASIVSTKGGPGKTTVTANLGAFCAGANLKTLLIDLDTQPSLSSFYRLDHEAPCGTRGQCSPGFPGEHLMNLSLVKQTGTELQSSSIAKEDELILQACEILERRLFSQEPVLSCPAAVSSYLKLKLAPEEHEVFAAVFLNAQHRPLAFEVLFTGSIDGAAVYPRQLVKRALFHNAAALIISHNHPSGCTEPSTSDIQLTKRVREALKLVDVRLIDHFIVGSGQPLSFAERGLI